jgi:hypothetical protein
MLAPLGATVTDVFPVVFPAVALDVVVPLAPMVVRLVPMLAPLGATVVDVALLIVVVFVPPLAFTGGGLPVVVVAFCGKQADCIPDIVVALVPLAAGPTDAPLGAGVTAVWLLPPMACAG